ncbi:Restriction endonuclease fold toxin 2 [Streptomyces sp. OV198]|uniref:restriction endonuclease fold toxin-2 domain-containing protein n=1 Tax=Streptomyces sp. OV198 TaxID=1882787 RepID=UPI000BCD43D2|nr:restriction endonuclease fold toxin-2 domain-containing protein [Streptomyces sp. OV198]SOE56814.1 Restriction endonuclease fold toxin 2 [Streptomyces sp. OV198]
MGLPPDLKVIAEGMVKASMGMVDTVMVGTRDTAIALSYELDRQHGMAGDDDAGRAFAKVYKSAAATTLDKMGFSAYVMGETGKGLMRNAREFMAQESRVVSAILNKQVDLTAGMGDPGADCTESFLGLGQELPEVVGDTAWYDQYAPAGMSDRFRGSPEKLRDVAGSWRAGGKMMLRFLQDAQAYAHTADKAHSGEAADAFRSYFKAFVGFGDPPDETQQDETLVANLVAACNQLAKACDRYADHVEAAKRKITQDRADLFHVDMPWDQPMFGGNGDDGGLQNAVLDDVWIHRLGNVAHALDESERRVKLPQGSDDPPGLPFPPLIPVPGGVPVPLVLASYRGQAPGILPMGNRVDPSIPAQDPIPPEPGATRPLTPGEQQRFRTWLNSLNTGGFAGGGGPTNPDNAYQLRVSGYPEREVPLVGRRQGLMVDGIRPADGYLVEAKHVRDPDCKKRSFRSIERVNETLAKPVKVDANGNPKWDPLIDGMYRGDESELRRYKGAMANPANSEIRGLEIVTNGKDNAAYWESMIAMNGVTGSARYVP